MKIGFGKKSLSLLLALALCLTLLPLAALAEDAAVEDVQVLEAIPAAAAIETAPVETPAAAPEAPEAPKAALQGGALNLVDMYFTDLNRPDAYGNGASDGYLLKDAEGTAKFTLSGGVAVAAACELQGVNLIATDGMVYDLLTGGYCEAEANHCEVMNNEAGQEEWHFVSLWMENVTIPDAEAADYVLQVVTSGGTYVSEAYEEEWGVSDGYVHIVNEMPKQTTPKITTTYLYSGEVGRPYTATLDADPVNPGDTITWSVTDGELPEGFTLDPSGEISGTPTAGGTYVFTVSAAEEGVESSQKKFWLSFYWPAPMMMAVTLSDGMVGVPYTATLAAKPYLDESTITWSLAEYSGPLPDGLTLSADGTLSGTPTTAGSFTFVPEATESGTGASTSRTLTLNIQETGFLLMLESVEARAGETVDVKLDVSNNPGIGGALLSLSCDSALTLTEITVGDALTGLLFTPPGDFAATPLYLVWDGLDNDNTNGTALTLTFAVSAEAQDGDYALTLACEPKGIYDADLNDVAVTVVSGKVTVKNSVPGDVSGDNTVNAKDVTVLRRYIAGGYDVQVNSAAVDVNKDGANNAKDVTVLRRYIAGGYGIVLG